MSLRREHPNFWLVAVAITLFHLVVGLSFLLSTDAVWKAPTYSEFVFRIFDRHWWGLAHLAAGGAALAGFVARRLGPIRVGIGIGTMLVITRAAAACSALIADAASGLNAIPIWVLIAVFHLGCAMEPATNPANRRT